MKKRNLCKLIFLLSLVMSVLAIYDGISQPDILQPVHPVWVSWALTISDFFMLIATFCVAYKLVFLHLRFWQLVLTAYISSAFVAMYFEYNAGGYTQYEMWGHGMASIFLLGVVCLPVVYYFDDFNKEQQ